MRRRARSANRPGVANEGHARGGAERRPPIGSRHVATAADRDPAAFAGLQRTEARSVQRRVHENAAHVVPALRPPLRQLGPPPPKDAERAASDEEQPADAEELPEGPVFYGQPSYPQVVIPVPPVYDIGYMRNYILLPHGTAIACSDRLRVPPVLPPPGLRPPSLQRMLDQWAVLESVPGYPVYGLQGPCYPY